jgi:hypothetical protein
MTREGMSGSHSYSREAAEPFAIKSLRETFESYPPKEQARIRADVIARLRDEARSREFAARVANDQSKRPGSALARFALAVYGIRVVDL